MCTIDWKNNESSFAETNKYMLQNEICCDVEFLVGSNDILTNEESVELIRCHKFILVSRSPIFNTMFMSQWTAPTQQIVITDITPSAFKTMLMFIYTEDCDINVDQVLPILYASKKYMLPALTQRCTAFLESNMTCDNVCMIREQCGFYDEEDLLNKCTGFIETRTEEILNSNAFLDISLSCLETLLNFERLSTDELTLYQACIRWSKKECERQGLPDTPPNNKLVLGDALYLLHFPSMPFKDFANKVSSEGILSPDDRCKIFEFIALTDAEKKAQKPADLRFPCSSRQRPDPLVLRRFSFYTKSNIYSGDCSMMRVKTNQVVAIKGFGVSGSLTLDPLAELNVTIKQDRNNFLCNKVISVTDKMDSKTITILLNETVELRTNVWYTIIITFQFNGDNEQGTCRRGKGGQKSIQVDGIDFEFDRPDSGSLIPEILFCRV